MQPEMSLILFLEHKRLHLSLISLLNQLKETKTFIKQYADQQDKENYDLALQYRAKLTELLNKY